VRPLLRRILTEPLLHFALLGAGLFALDAATRGDARADEPGTILVTRGDVEHLATGFLKLQGRPPTAEELAGLVRERVRDEVYAREAKALGLDRDDTIVRRRLRQKMEFLFDDVTAWADPSEADLEAHLRARPDAFRVEPNFTFQHVYLSPAKRGAEIGRDAARLLATLRDPGARADPAELGDPTLLAPRFEAVPAGDVAKQFGEGFATRLATLPVGTWDGPIESAYGTHLVLVAEKRPGRVPPLAEVRDAVRRDWANERRSTSSERFYRELLQRYTVTIEGHDETAMDGAPAAQGR
jgi:hypothetical protein